MTRFVLPEVQWQRQQMALQALTIADVLAEVDHLIASDPEEQHHPLYSLVDHALDHTTQAGTGTALSVRPALAVQQPDLGILGKSPRPALRGLRLGLRRRRTRGCRHGDMAVRLDDRRPAERFAHRSQRVPMGAEDLIEGFGQGSAGGESGRPSGWLGVHPHERRRYRFSSNLWQ
jgi:hypothetical protein